MLNMLVLRTATLMQPLVLSLLVQEGSAQPSSLMEQLSLALTSKMNQTPNQKASCSGMLTMCTVASGLVLPVTLLSIMPEEKLSSLSVAAVIFAIGSATSNSISLIAT